MDFVLQMMTPAGLALAISVSFFIAIASLLYGLKAHSQLQTMHLELANHQRQEKILSSGAYSIGQRLLVLEKKIDKLETKQGLVEQSDAQFSYSQAIALLQQGVPAETVAVNCDLSQSEVSLMALLHKQQADPLSSES